MSHFVLHYSIYGYIFQWEEDRESVRQKSAKVMGVLRNVVAVSGGGEKGEGPPGSSCVQNAHRSLSEREDKEYGGFGSAPKFPQPGKKTIHICLNNCVYT